MKKCKLISCWTDYPFDFLGDKRGEKAPIRHVIILSYDRDKYAKILVQSVEAEVKIGYLYTKKTRYGQHKNVNRRKLERMIDTERNDELKAAYKSNSI